MPCDVKPCDDYGFLKNTDVWIVGSPYIESENGINSIPQDHPLRQELFSLEQIVSLIQKYNIKSTIISHIEEMWGLSYEDYKKVEKENTQYNIKFAFDGMKINL